MEDKTCRLLKAIENPELFSDEELRLILEDPENIELYNLLSKTTDALTETKNPDIDKEWNDFERKYIKSDTVPAFFTFITRNAAAILICIVSTLAVVAASLGIIYSGKHNTDTISRPPKIEIQGNTRAGDILSVQSSVGNDNDDSGSQNVIFKNESFGNIIDAIANYYDATVKYSSDRAKELNVYFQWDRELSLQEVVDELNSFEQIKITVSDNVLTIE